MDFEERLSKLAAICLEVGVNLQRGQELIVTAPIEARPLVHQVARIGYRLGAALVTCLYDDPEMIGDRLRFASDDTLDHAAEWLSHGVSRALERGAARLFVVGPYPDLLAGVPPEKVVRVHTAMGKASSEEMRFTADSLVNWSTVPFVTASWARTVFPDLPEAQATVRLWDAVFDITRVDVSDPVAAWKAHNRMLLGRRKHLQRKGFSALRFYDGRTDLTVGLAEGHRWVGGTVVGANGVEALCNIPTEEVFTCPHRERTNGRVFFSRPLVLAGSLVEGLCVDFRDGVVASIRADKGEEVFDKLLSADEGARRLGEVGLVPSSSLVGQSGVLFYNPLFDENAASHIAFGNSYAACIEGSGAGGSERGANQSTIHIDCMVGHPSMNVDGISGAGYAEPVMRDGEFLI